MNKLLVVFAIFIAIQFTQAQNYKFGKVSKEELQETSSSLDPEANATVLYRKQNIGFYYDDDKGFIQKNEVHERIKIYNKEGFDQATKIVWLYNASHDSKEELSGLKAYTYNLEGGKVIDDKLKKDGIFDEETNKYWKTKKFTMPNIKEGSVIEYKYTIESLRLHIRDVDIQQDIPIKKIDFQFASPEYFNYKKYMNPKAAFYPQFVESTVNRKVSLTSRVRTGGVGTSTVKTTFDTQNLEFLESKVTVNEENIPALKDEPMVSNINNYKAQVKFELNYIKYPNQPFKYLSTTWEKVSKTIYKYEDFGGQIKKTNYYKDDLNTLLSGVSNPQEKIALIYNFVKSKVKWNDFNGYSANDGVRKAYKEGVGNVGDINLMLVSMLRYAGLNADPVLVSTKDNGIPLFPTRNGFNYVIAIVKINGSTILLDASNKFSTTNILPLNTLNWQGRLIKKDGTSSWVKLNPTIPSKEILSLSVKLDQDLSITGKVRNQYTNYQAMRYRNRYENFTDDEIIERLIEDKGELEISNLTVKNKEDLSKPILQSYDYSYENAIEQIGDKLYFSPLLFLTSEENPFKTDARNYPIDFIYPIADEYRVNVMLPEGYVVESLPESAKFQFNNNDGMFAYLVRQNGNMLQIIITLNLNKTLILSKDYQDFKQFYQMFIDKQTEKVVLSKAI